jgi:hypothetical protein
MAKGKEKRKKERSFSWKLQIQHKLHTERQMIYHFRHGRKRLARGKEKRKKKEASRGSLANRERKKQNKNLDNICKVWLGATCRGWDN